MSIKEYEEQEKETSLDEQYISAYTVPEILPVPAELFRRIEILVNGVESDDLMEEE